MMDPIVEAARGEAEIDLLRQRVAELERVIQQRERLYAESLRLFFRFFNEVGA